MYQFDVAIMGGGPGGYVAGIRCAQAGFKTVLFERERVGGTCLNIGCIPTKTLLKNAEMLEEIAAAPARGISVGKPEINMPTIIKMKNEVVSQLTSGVQYLLKGNGVTLISGEAEVLTNHVLRANGEEYTFDKLIIATGSSNFVPPIQGLDLPGIMTSTELLNIDHVPERLIIIGGGVIGCEFATIFNQFGCKVTIIEMLPNIVSMMDADISEMLRNLMGRKGIDIKTGCKVLSAEADREGYTVKFCKSDGETAVDTISAEKVLVSVGRTPNLKGFENLKLAMNGSYIAVNERMQTSIEDIYAVGDITGTIQLAHVASTQANIAVENIAGRAAVMEYNAVPNCIFTLPEIASIGLAEAAARSDFGNVKIGKFPFAGCGKALAMGHPEGFVKVIAAADTGKLLGCHIIGVNATELIAEAAAVMHAGKGIDDIAETIHSHPTVSEAIAEAAHAAQGKPLHILK